MAKNKLSDYRIGIVGAGTMGAGLAQLAAFHGNPVVVFDSSPSMLTSLTQKIEQSLSRRIERGQLAPEQLATILDRIKTCSALKEFRYADLVIEAISEDLEAKRSLFVALERIVDDSCILTTNTSSLSVTAIAAACQKPGRVLGFHFFNPAHVLPLVEIIPALQTEARFIETTKLLAESWGKTTVLAKDTPAFIVNRVARPFYGEALRILEEGIADISTIDWAMKHFGGFKMGPFELMDFIGVDVNYAVTCCVFEAFYYDSRYRPSLLQKQMVDAKRFGRKTGIGFYNYSTDAKRPLPTENSQIGEMVFQRIFATLVNEALETVFWGVASHDSVDLAVKLGVNYPKGLIAWAKEIGPPRVLSILEDLHSHYQEERYRPSVLLKSLVNENRWFDSGRM